jgi:hypothetical protein
MGSKGFLGGKPRVPANWKLSSAIKASTRPIERAPFSWRPHAKTPPQPEADQRPRQFTQHRRKEKITLATKVTFLAGE